ncbi:MAG: glycerol-3-phosphate 1-O-acyltransferase PlsY [Synergistaceae bacterium]|jgi:glycerol-3-phosphate acyltransferase PlsY|nr:glycerol-3-phosphate 1-O-acyltransferase PlsY [Synergistaceae bacterium]
MNVDMFADFFPWLVLGYLMGSCPTGYVLVKLFKGEDIRKLGSGNIGATNVSRVLGKKWAVFTAVVDMIKGGAAVLITMSLGHDDPLLLSSVGVFGVIGHNYPIWIGFRGGKGVATTFGVFGCYNFWNPLPAIIGGIAWFLVREVSCMASLSSMTSLAVAVILMPIFAMPRPYYMCGIFLVALSVWRHRENIKRIASGAENKLQPFFLHRGGGSGKTS